MAIALVASTEMVASLHGGTSPAIDTTGANLLVAGLSYYSIQGDLTPTDSKGNTWSGLTSRTNGASGRVRLCYVMNPTVGSGHTFSFLVNDSYPLVYILALSGADVSSVFEAESGSASSATPGEITPAGDGRLFVTALALGGGSGALTIDEGFTISGQNDFSSGNYFGGALAYLIQSAAAARNPTWTTPATPATSMATFIPAAAAGGILPILAAQHAAFHGGH